jgi:tocopherol O-methyltransferase
MRSSEVSDYYDRLDLWYRSLWGDHLHHGLWKAGTRTREEASGHLLEAVTDASQLHPGMAVGDVGCGYGGPARWFANEKKVRVVAITNSRKQFEGAERSAEVEFRLEDWLESDLPDHSCDAVVAIESLSHFPKPVLAIRQMLRVAKPGGRVVITTWCEGDVLSNWARRWLIDPLRRDEMLNGLVSNSKIREWIVESGGEMISEELVGREVRHSWVACMGRAARSLLTDGILRKEVLRNPRQALRLALSSLRIWLAYRLGALDYTILVFKRD